MIYIILGMHKSGTTLVSQILHHSGISMGNLDESRSYDAGNKYECQDCLHINMRLLGVDDFDVLDVAPSPSLRLDAESRRAMAEVCATNEARGGDWGFKDPRTCLTYDLWVECLPDHRIIAVYRDPAHIWPRFKWLGRRLYHTNFRRACRFLLRWHEHNLAIARLLEEGGRPHLLLNYHDFMTDPAGFAALERFAARELDDRREPGMYRCRQGGDLFLAVADRWLGYRQGLSVGATMDRLARLQVDPRNGATP